MQKEKIGFRKRKKKKKSKKVGFFFWGCHCFSVSLLVLDCFG